MENIKLLSLIAAVIIGLMIILKICKDAYSSKIILFHSLSCGHCKKFMPEWKKVKDYYSFSPSFSTRDFEAHDFQNKLIMQNFNVDGVPFIVAVNPNGTRYNYNGERTAKAIIEFANQL